MATETNTIRRVQCPSCRQNAKRVSPVTLRALLKDQSATEIDGDHSCCDSNGEGCTPIAEDTGWRFCDSPDCDIVYFSEKGDITFTKSQLKVPVGVKETSGERPLCYCFRHSVASIKDELRTKGRSVALDDIRAKMKNPGCHCETSNPSGACCLGSVAKGIETARKELDMATSQDAPATLAQRPTNRGETIAKLGTLVSAIMASACCWLPLVLLAVGVSGAGIASTLEAYRPLFIVVTFGFLGAAFYFTYRPRKADAAHDCCAPEGAAAEECCSSEGKRRFSMMTFNKAMLWVVTALAVAFLFFPSYVGLLLGTDDEAAMTVTEDNVVLRIDGMTCEGCATVVENILVRTSGVLSAKVDYTTGRVVVGIESCCPVPKSEILAALQQAGYEGAFVNAQRRNTNSETNQRLAK